MNTTNGETKWYETLTIKMILLGGLVPLVKIAERIYGDFVMDYCRLTRYRGGTVPGDLSWVLRPTQDLRGRTIVIIDDIFDEGQTMAEVHRYCRQCGAARVLSAVLARKKSDRSVLGPGPDFVGLEVGDEYVFGCGMDFRERWRHLREIYAVPARPLSGRASGCSSRS